MSSGVAIFADVFMEINRTYTLYLADASQHGLPFIASHPSRTIKGNRTSAATGSAHLTPQIALMTSPAKAIIAR